MEEAIKNQLKRLFAEEIELRKLYRGQLKQLSETVNIATEHNRRCVRFWNEHFDDGIVEIVINMGDDGCYKIKRPELESAKVETSFTYGIDYEKTTIIDL